MIEDTNPTTGEAEITPEMAEAGERVLAGWLGAEVSGIAPALANEVYLAMTRARDTGSCLLAKRSRAT